MPWRESSVVDERMEFITAYQSGLYTMTELADQFGISRKTAYKLLKRFESAGPAGLSDHSRRPRSSPLAIEQDLVEAIVASRGQHPRWGPKKLLKVLQRQAPKRAWPAVSTAALVLKRHGLTRPRRRRASVMPTPPAPFIAPSAPNEVWTTDFKGQFRTGDTRWCYPLTIMDRYSRYLLAVRGQSAPTFARVRGVFVDVFREVGLPRYIHSDNGEPFVGHGLAGLSQLSVWWLRLGIRPELGRSAHPEDNPEHERMHRTLKADTARPPAACQRAQQRRFATFIQEYNWDRPHEAIDFAVPGERYAASPRAYPCTLPPLEYPGHYDVRFVSQAGAIKWNGRPLFLSTVLRHQYVGLEEIDDGVWDVYFTGARVGRFDARAWTLLGSHRLRFKDQGDA